MGDLKTEQLQIIDLVYQAGEIAKKISEGFFSIQDKGGGLGPVTEADQAVNDFLVTEISKRFPEDLIISEESPSPPKNFDLPRTWWIDPIDGTKEFICKNGEWSIMVGLVSELKPKLGVVYQPVTGDLYYALAGQGAYHAKDVNPIRSSPIKVNLIQNVSQATLIESRSHPSARSRQVGKLLGVSKTLKQGSVGLKLARISEGKADLYLNFSCQCHLWDLCAGEVILQEAGGDLIHLNGQKIDYSIREQTVESPFIAGIRTLIEPVRNVVLQTMKI